jgi:hypothetical protein
MRHVFRAMVFNCPQNIPAQKESALFGHQIPVLRLQKIHAVRKREAEPGRPMPFLMPLLHGLNGRRQPRQRASYYTCHWALEWQSEFSFKGKRGFNHKEHKERKDGRGANAPKLFGSGGKFICFCRLKPALLGCGQPC